MQYTCTSSYNIVRSRFKSPHEHVETDFDKVQGRKGGGSDDQMSKILYSQVITQNVNQPSSHLEHYQNQLQHAQTDS